MADLTRAEAAALARLLGGATLTYVYHYCANVPGDTGFNNFSHGILTLAHPIDSPAAYNAIQAEIGSRHGGAGKDGKHLVIHSLTLLHTLEDGAHG